MSLLVRPGLEIPDADLEVAFIRSSGPGGQNVNKVASAVQLRFALERNQTLPRRREVAAARSSPASASPTRANCSSSRALRAARNTTAATPKRACSISCAARLIAPKKRHATKPTRASKERRLSSKSRSQKTKRLRGSVKFDD